MNAEELEQAICLQVSGLAIPAQAYPQNPANYIPAAYPGEVLTRYVGAKYTPSDVSGVKKNRQQVVELVVVSQELRGENGAYAWLDQIREHLEGFVMLGAGGAMELESEEFQDEYNGTWQFVQRWNLKSVIGYEQQDDYADRPLSSGG